MNQYIGQIVQTFHPGKCQKMEMDENVENIDILINIYILLAEHVNQQVMRAACFHAPRI